MLLSRSLLEQSFYPNAFAPIRIFLAGKIIKKTTAKKNNSKVALLWSCSSAQLFGNCTGYSAVSKERIQYTWKAQKKIKSKRLAFRIQHMHVIFLPFN